jgi:UDP-GlcNAc:undecaprenyl-phosphate/decaprenyl-phosphate GlcNAc-1-phosphate transferase
MIDYIPILVVALAFALTGTPLAKWLAVRVGLLDRPNQRKVHTVPTPLLGGVAIYVAFLVALVLFWKTGGLGEVIGIVTGATLMATLGVLDDSGRLHSQVKLLVGMPIATILLIVAGVQATFLPFQPLNLLVTLFWVMGITAAFNLLDNMDGLAAGIAAIASAFFLWHAAENGQYLVGTLAAALLGAALGFLRYNYNPAKIFMGDAGALFLGFVIAALGIKLRFLNQVESVSWMVPIIIMGVPILDTSLVTISRLRRGLNPMATPGKDHLSHRLVALGLSPRNAVAAIFLLAIGLGLVSIVVSKTDSIFVAYGIGLALVVASLAAIALLEKASYDGNSTLGQTRAKIANSIK